jgi:hypothetical protein
MTGLKDAVRGLSLSGLAWAVLVSAASAQSPLLRPALAPIGFLVGHWT